MLITGPTLRLPPGAPGGGSSAVWRGNEPPGFTQVSDHPFSTLDNSPSSPLWDTFGATGSGDGGVMTIEVDATAPHSPSNVIRATYPLGFGGDGNAPGHIGLQFTGQRQLYFCYWMKYSSNFWGHSTGINKISYCWIDATFTPFVMESEGVNNNPLAPHVILQNMVSGDGHYPPNTGDTGVTFTRGSWDLIECVLTGNSASTANGSFKLYFNGSLSMDYSGLQWSSNAGVFDIFEFQPVWGGVDPADSVPASMYIQWDECYLSQHA